MSDNPRSARKLQNVEPRRIHQENIILFYKLFLCDGEELYLLRNKIKRTAVLITISRRKRVIKQTRPTHAD
jgi:hypothetical protein